jgi:hypothetical protein
MPHYKSLKPDERTKRRSIADAIDLLHDEGARSARIQVDALQLASQDVVGLIAVFAKNAVAGSTSFVTLPTCEIFCARRDGSQELEEFDIFRLEGAIVDGRGTVELADGTRLRAVEVVPALLPYNVTDLDWRILHCTIARMNAEQECYTYPIRFADRRDALDCSTLRNLSGRIPLLKEIQGDIADEEPALKDLSEQKIADTLCKFGIRLPRPRRTQRLGSTATG